MDDIFKNNAGLLSQAFDGIKAISDVGEEYKDYFWNYDTQEIINMYFRLGRYVADAKWNKEYEDRCSEEVAVASAIDFDSIPEPTTVTNSYDIKDGSISLEFSSKSLDKKSIARYKSFVACSLLEKNTDPDNCEALKTAIASFETNKKEILKEFKDISDSDKSILPELFQKNVLSNASSLSEKGKEQLTGLKRFVSFSSENGINVYMNSIKDGSRVYTLDDKGNKIEVSKATFEILGGAIKVEVENGVIATVNPKNLLVQARSKVDE